MFRMSSDYWVSSSFDLFEARGQPLPADPSWQEAILFLLVCVKFLYFFLRFTVSLCVRCDMVVLACSLEHKILSLQTAGLWYSTWCLTASRTVSAFDDSAFVPDAGFWYFTTHTDCDCVPFCRTPRAPQESCQMWSFVRWDLPTPTITSIVCMLVVALYIFGGWWFLCIHSLHTHRDFCCLTAGAAPPRAHTAVPVTSRNNPASESVGQGDSPSSLSCHSFQLLVFHPPNLPLMKFLFYQHHSLKHISATPDLSVQRAFRSPLCPFLPLSASFPESSPLPTLPVCHPSVLMRGRDQQCRPLEFDRATCCASTFLPP